MNGHLFELIHSFSRLQVLVVGEAMLDCYLEGEVNSLCREAPVPVVKVQKGTAAVGGGANAAANVRSLGGQVHMLSVVGDDAEGARLCQALGEQGISPEHVLTCPSRRTLLKRRILGNGQMLLRLDEGSTGPLDEEIEKQLIQRLGQLYRRCDAVIVSDYHYGIITPRVIEALESCQARTPRLLVVDSKKLAAYQHVGVSAVKPNYREAVQLLGGGLIAENGERPEQMLQHGDRLLEITGAEIAAVTLDTDGALVFERNGIPYRTYAEARPHSHATGAGDTFTSAFTLALASGAFTPAAAELASQAAAIVVERDRTALCSADDLRGYLCRGEKYLSDWNVLAARIDFYRQHGKRIVFTNGCFDILHRGHIAYLGQAKARGDVLVVGVNSDDSVRRLKGPTRPINSLDDRLHVLAALSCVDHVVPFEEDLPHNLIRVVRPDVFVKGGDYTREMLPEAALVEELGGRVEILPYVQDHSTSSVIERIQQLHPGLRASLGKEAKEIA